MAIDQIYQPFPREFQVLNNNPYNHGVHFDSLFIFFLQFHLI